MIQAVIFDMDGVLIDSEPLWFQAETEILATVGFHLTYETWKHYQGMDEEQVLKHYYSLHPWNGKSISEVKSEIIKKVGQLVTEQGTAKEGVDYIMDFCKRKNLRKSLASSSNLELILTVLQKIDLINNFEVIHSSEFEKAGKPAPDVYLSTAEKMNLHPGQCLVIEDSYHGLMAAKSAGMKCIAIPEHDVFNDAKFNIADIKLRKLCDFDELIINKLSQ